MKARLIVSMLVVAVAAAMVGGATFAWFTDEAVSEGNMITAGKLTVELTGENGAAYQFFTIENSQPGDVFDEVVFELHNTGNLELAYVFNFVLDEDTDTKLADAIYIRNWKNALYGPDGAKIWEDHFIVDKQGQYPFFGDVIDANGDGYITLAEWLAEVNNGMGIAHGWDPGGLVPGAKFVNWLELGFRETAGNEYQGLEMNVALQVFASQARADAYTQMFIDNNIPSAGNAQWVFNDTVEKRLNQQR